MLWKILFGLCVGCFVMFGVEGSLGAMDPKEKNNNAGIHIKEDESIQEAFCTATEKKLQSDEKKIGNRILCVAIKMLDPLSGYKRCRGGQKRCVAVALILTEFIEIYRDPICCTAEKIEKMKDLLKRSRLELDVLESCPTNTFNVARLKNETAIDPDVRDLIGGLNNVVEEKSFTDHVRLAGVSCGVIPGIGVIGGISIGDLKTPYGSRSAVVAVKGGLAVGGELSAVVSFDGTREEDRLDKKFLWDGFSLSGGVGVGGGKRLPVSGGYEANGTDFGCVIGAALARSIVVGKKIFSLPPDLKQFRQRLGLVPGIGLSSGDQDNQIQNT